MVNQLLKNTVVHWAAQLKFINLYKSYIQVLDYYTDFWNILNFPG